MQHDLHSIGRRIIELQIEHRDLDYLIGRLAGTEDHFRQPRAHRAMIVDAGEAQVLVG